MNIGIIDNQNKFHKIIKNKLQQHLEYELNIYTFGNVYEMDETNTSFDLIFLDVNMNDIDGIIYAKENRDKNIIFISNQMEKMKEAFGPNVYGFIEESHLEDDCDEIIESVIQDILNIKYIEFKIEKTTKQFNANEILYLQYISGRTIGFVYKNHQYIIKSSILKDVKEILGDQFIYIDRNTLINLNMIKDITGNKILLKGIPQLFDISKRRVSNVKKLYKKSI